MSLFPYFQLDKRCGKPVRDGKGTVQASLNPSAYSLSGGGIQKYLERDAASKRY